MSCIRPCFSDTTAIEEGPPSSHNKLLILDAFSHLYIRVRPSIGPSFGASVTLFFLNLRKRVFLTSKTAKDCGWREEVIGSDEGGREGLKRG